MTDVTRVESKRLTLSVPQMIRNMPARMYIAGAILGLIVVAALAAPLLISYSPLDQDLLARNQGPSWLHMLGTDHLGRDIYARLIAGSRTTLIIGTAGTALAFIIGAGVGLFAISLGRFAETGVFALIDLVRALPGTLLALLLIVALGSGVTPLVLALGISYSPLVAYVARAAYKREVSRDYVKSARSFGGGPLHVLKQHIMPNLVGTLVTQAAIFLPRCIVTESVLSFLGVGSSPDAPTWGRMISDASRTMQQSPYALVVPMVGLVLLTVSISVVGDYLRRKLDPMRDEDSQASMPDPQSRNTLIV
jgi:peptide/nickel transport system permease protein